jgi:hypothetical protein
MISMSPSSLRSAFDKPSNWIALGDSSWDRVLGRKVLIIGRFALTPVLTALVVCGSKLGGVLCCGEV